MRESGHGSGAGQPWERSVPGTQGPRRSSGCWEVASLLGGEDHRCPGAGVVDGPLRCCRHRAGGSGTTAPPESWSHALLSGRVRGWQLGVAGTQVLERAQKTWGGGGLDVQQQ